MNFDATLIYWHRLNKLYDLLREELLKKFGITQIESEILVYLAFHEAFGEAGGDTASDIAESRILSKSNVSKGVYSLMKKGFLVGEQDERDRRVTHLKLTENANRDLVVSEVNQMNDRFNRLISEGIPHEELQQLVETERKLSENAARAISQKMYLNDNYHINDKEEKSMGKQMEAIEKIEDFNMQGFYDGKVFNCYEFFGAHLLEDGRCLFRTYAPNARRVTLTGDCNGWQETDMVRYYNSGVFTYIADNAQAGQKYEYVVYGQNGSVHHSDPYGFSMELRPQHASVIVDMNEYEFHDGEWLAGRTLNYDKPLNIYEMHLGSWRTNPDDPNGWYTYSEIADRLISYVKEHGYTHIEFLPLAEHPFDGSWGYQNTGFFSATSRYGTPRDLMELVDKCHQNGVGVIMDFVPVHFALDDYALRQFDGTALYEYPHHDVGESEWGSCNFMHSRREVACFLQSAAEFWLRVYHFDGLRMDAISRAIYWQGDPRRGVNGSTVEFLKIMNKGLREHFPTAMLIAEDSTSFPDITKPVDKGGLGFDYKWDLGWMNDTLSYFSQAPENRSGLYHKLTFSMMYYYNERYLLPLSHDEVVHGKGTIVNKMYGEYEEKFRQARAFYTYMYLHPGKKLNFMGNELGQLREWDEKREQDWNLLEYPMHDGFCRYISALSDLYLTHPALSALECETAGFDWLDCRSEGDCLYAMLRRSDEEKLVAVFNFSDRDRDGYSLTVEGAETLTPLLCSEWQRFGGSLPEDASPVTGSSGQFTLSVPALSALVFQTV